MITLHQCKLDGLLGKKAKVSLKGGSGLKGIVEKLGIVSQKREAFHIIGTEYPEGKEINLNHVRLVQAL